MSEILLKHLLVLIPEMSDLALQCIKNSQRTKVFAGYGMYLPSNDTVYDATIEIRIPEHVTYEQAYDAIGPPFFQNLKNSMRNVLKPGPDEIQDLVCQAKKSHTDLEAARHWLEGKLDTLAYFITEDLEILPYYGPINKIGTRD